MAKKLSDIWKNRKLILEGIMNNTFKKDHIELIARERLNICKSCELLDKEGKNCLIPGTQPCCSDCGCKLALKIRSLSASCTHPDGPKWEAVLDEEEQDKLYKDINYNPDQPSEKL